eukprot:gb/GECG01005471.1/.p1 GENE.gb/GECG01005471.1/~~gb/GECG01005471.1/.p1  ORF type:complete len:383 (+),score=63.78 gb/GECG01005471.1/:1-1149(+)
MKRSREELGGSNGADLENKQQRVATLLDGIVPGDSPQQDQEAELQHADNTEVVENSVRGNAEQEEGVKGQSLQGLTDAQLLEAIEGSPRLDVLNTTQYNIEKLLQEFPRTISIEKKTESRRIGSHAERRIVDIAPVDVALQTQLYDFDSDPTRIENDIDEICRAGMYMRVHLPATQDQPGIIRKKEYQAYVRRLSQALQSSVYGQVVADAFVEWSGEKTDSTPLCSNDDVDRIRLFCNQYVKKQHLESFLNTEDVIRQLLHLGVLMRRSHTSVSEHQDFWVTLPNSVKLQKYIEEGRRELQQRLSKVRYQEVDRAYLENKFRYRFGKSPLPAAFHVRDAIGAVIVLIRKRASGTFIRLNKKVSERARASRARRRPSTAITAS